MKGEGDFKTRFYNLEGVHVDERKRNFYKLLKTIPLDTDIIQLDIRPRNYLERLFFIDILIHFRQTGELLNILKEGNGTFTSKIFKEQWFFQEAFQDMNEANIVNLFIPTLSCCLRGKVLKNIALAVTVEKMDKIVELVIERYGISTAQPLLFSCSEQTFRKIITNYDINLKPSELKSILHKKPHFIKIYFENYKQAWGKEYDNKDFLNYACWKKPDFFFDLGINKISGVTLGRRTTKNLLKYRKREVLDDTVINYYKFNTAQLTRRISDFSTEFLPKFFPENLEHFIEHGVTRDLLRKVLDKYPKKKRWDIMRDVFYKVYGKDVTECLDYFHYDFVNYFPVEVKYQWAHLMYSKTNSTGMWTYYDPEEAFELIKSKILLTSKVNRRIEYLNQLISSCYKNKAYETYREVLKYISARHRNDNIISVLNHVANYFDPDEFTEIHWQYVNEIKEALCAKEQVIPNIIITEYLLYLVKKGLSLDEALRQFITHIIKLNFGLTLSPNKQPQAVNQIWRRAVVVAAGMEENRRALREVFYAIVKFNGENKEFAIDLNQYQAIQDIIRETCQKKKQYDLDDCSIIASLLTYNAQMPENPIKVCSDGELLDLIKTSNKDSTGLHVLFEAVMKSISKTDRSTLENDLLHYYISDWFQELPGYMRNIYRTMQYFMKNEPGILQKYFSLILKYDENLNFLDFSTIKKYSHLNLDQKFIDYHSENITAKMPRYTKSNMLKGLAVLMHTEDFLNLISDYLPKETKLDLKSEKAKELYPLQCDIIKRIQTVDEPVKVIPFLFDFCRGDYLNVSLVTLYNILNRVGEKDASLFINSIRQEAMSLRKHSVFLAFRYLPLSPASDLFLTVSDGDSNVSAKKYLLRAILKYFLRNPVDSVAKIIISKLETVDKNDEELLDALAESVTSVPNKFKIIFTETLWRTLEDFKDDSRVSVYCGSILNQIQSFSPDIFSTFSEDFCKGFIQKYFLSTVNNPISNTNEVYDFVVRYLYSKDTKQRFEFVFEIVRKFKEVHFKDQSKKLIKHIYDFFNIALTKIVTYERNFLTVFADYWRDTFDTKEHFCGFCSLRLLELYKDNSEQIELFAREVDSYYKTLLIDYGPYVNLLLLECLQSLFGLLEKSKKADFSLEDFIVNILTINSSEMNCFLATNVVKGLGEKNNKKIKQITELLAKSKNEATEILYCSIFNNKSLENN